MNRDVKDPSLGRVSSEHAEILLPMLGSDSLREATELSQKIIIELISDILSNEPNAWNITSDWVAKCAEGTSLQRWAALSEAVLIARNTIYTINRKAPEPESEEEIQALFDFFKATDNGSQTGIRDGLFMLSLTATENQILEPDWLWYATSDCESERYFGTVMVIFYAIVATVTRLSSVSDMEPSELWATFSILIS
jgi:hypothetical protein